MFSLPDWLIKGLGGLLIAFVALGVVETGYELSKSFQSQKPENTIAISAEGRVNAVPDLATVNLGVISIADTAKQAQDENTKKANQISDFVLKQGIDKKDITTSQFTIYPRYDYSNNQNNIIGYQSNQVVTVKIRCIDESPEKIGKILEGATSAGANEVQGLSYSFEDPDDLRQEARKIAIAKAKEKAQELADEAGLRLGKVVSIAEFSSGGVIPVGLRDGFGGGGAAVPDVQPGSQDVVENITVVFEVK